MKINRRYKSDKIEFFIPVKIRINGVIALIVQEEIVGFKSKIYGRYYCCKLGEQTPIEMKVNRRHKSD